MLYILLIVLAIIMDNPWPIVVGIALWLFATWEPTPKHIKYNRKYGRRKR